MNRRPFMVDFREVGGAARLFRCLFNPHLAAHGPAGTHVTGTTAVADIADMDPAHNTTAAPDYYVACGDFNVNDYWMHETNAAYPPLTALNYRRMLRTANTDSTHYLRDHEADPLNAPFSYQQVQIIDNFFVLRHPGPQPGLATYTKVSIDSVEGAPAPWDSVMGQDLNTIKRHRPRHLSRADRDLPPVGQLLVDRLDERPPAHLSAHSVTDGASPLRTLRTRTPWRKRSRSSRSMTI